MNVRSTTAVGALVIGAMTIGLGTAHASPATPAPSKPVIDYSVQLKDAKQANTPQSVVTTLKGGTFQLVNKPGATPKAPPVQAVDIKDQTGKTVIEFPLDFRVADAPIPMQASLQDNNKVLQLDPQKPAGVDVAQVSKNPMAVLIKPVASPMEDQDAMNNFATEFGIATAVGGFVGTAIGVVVGALTGCIVGGVIIPLVGCIPGIVAGAGFGGVLGTLAVGGPALIAAGVQLIQTLQAKPGTTQWANNGKGPNK